MLTLASQSNLVFRARPINLVQRNFTKENAALASHGKPASHANEMALPPVRFRLQLRLGEVKACCLDFPIAVSGSKVLRRENWDRADVRGSPVFPNCRKIPAGGRDGRHC